MYKNVAMPVGVLRSGDPGQIRKYGLQKMTAQEIVERQAEETVAADEDSRRAAFEARRAALAERWPDAFALFDDIAARGMEAVMEERAAIKAANPKPE